MFPNEQFTITQASVSSNVSDQPMSDKETFQGATNRVNNAVALHPDADYWVGQTILDSDLQTLNDPTWVEVLNG